MFTLRVHLAKDTIVTLDDVEQVIAPQGSMRFWSVFLPPDEHEIRTTLFYNEAHVILMEMVGKDEEEEETGGVVRDFRVVQNDQSPESA